MIFFFGLIALLGSSYLAYKLRKERSFRGSQERMVTHTGEVIAYEYDKRTHKGTSTHRLGIAVNSAVDLRIEHEDMFGRFLRSLGVGRDVQVGNSSLDVRYLFESDDPRVEAWLKGDSEARATLSTLMAMDVARFNAHDRRMWVTLVRKHDQEIPKLELLQSLWALAQRAPALIGEHARTLAGRVKASVLLAISMGLVIAALLQGLGALVPDFPRLMHPTGFYWSAFGCALALGLLLLWLAARWIGDSSRARVVLAELSTVGLIAFVAWATFSSGSINVALAPSEVHLEHTTIAGAYTRQRRSRRGGRSTSYYFVFPTFDHGRIEGFTLKVPSNVYVQFAEGDQVLVKWQHGLLGAPFVVDAPIPRQPAERMVR
jgi:hypothetical protein